MKNYISTYAFFLVLIATLLGVTVTFKWWLISAIICSIFLLLYQFNWRLALVWIAFGGLANQLQLRQKSQWLDLQSDVRNTNAWWIEVVRTISKDSATTRFEVDILGVIHRDTARSLKNARAQISISTVGSVLMVGDLAIINNPALSKPAPPISPWDFDFESFYESRHILGKSKIKNAQILWVQTQEYSMDRRMEQIKHNINSAVRPFLAAPAFELYKGVIWGDKGQISETMMQGFQVSGTMHILSVSGMHMALIYGILVFCLKHLTRSSQDKEWMRLFLIPLFWVYAFFTGMSPPVFRAALFISINLIGRYIVKRPVRVADLICLLATLQLWWNPSSIYDIGFQLSYAAMVGIGFVIPIAEKWNPFTSKFLGYFYDSVLVTLACSFTTLPLILIHFHQFPVWFLLGNLILVPLFSLFMYLLIVLMFCTGIKEVAAVLGYLTNMVNGWIEWCILQILKLPSPFLFAYSVDFVDAVFFATFVILGIYWVSHKRSFISWGMFILMALYILCNRYWPVSERLGSLVKRANGISLTKNTLEVELNIPPKKMELDKWKRISQTLDKDSLKITVMRK